MTPAAFNRSRRSTTRWQHLYGSQRWRKASAAFLRRPENALCRPCKARGLVVASEATDHIVEHRGSERLFWDEDNWQPICWSCHSAKSRHDETERRTGRPRLRSGCDANGIPIDPRHPWNVERNR
jgi:5-methylcytosine-specific restriction enzyme A